MNDLNQNSETNRTNYTNMHSSVLGNLYRFRHVPVSRGKGYYAVSLTAKHGDKSNPDITYFELNIVGQDVDVILRNIEECINSRDYSVSGNFVISDYKPDSYVVQTGTNAGQRRHIIRGRLLSINSLKYIEVEDGKAKRDESDNVIETIVISPLSNDRHERDSATNQDADEDQTSEPDQALNEELDNSAEAVPASDQAIDYDTDEPLPNIIRLQKDDPMFDTKRKQLKALGYKFVPKDLSWQKAA